MSDTNATFIFALHDLARTVRLYADQRARQYGMTRAQWDDSLNWMTTKHGMNAIEGDDRKLILDYLEQHYPPTTRAGGRDSPNPFLK